MRRNTNLRVFTDILGGGKGERLLNVTKSRAKPSTRFAGYDLLEIMINLSVAAGHRRIDVYTEHLSSSMMRTIRAWDREVGGDGWVVDFHTEGARLAGPTRGSGDALYESADRRGELWRDYDITDEDVFTVLSADHVTNLDLGALVYKHLATRSDITLAVAKVDVERAAGELGVVILDEKGNVVGFQEKPSLAEIASIPGEPGFCYANTANIAYKPSVLEESVERFYDPTQKSYDQSRHILVPLVEEGKRKIKAFIHEGYWSDVGKLDALFDANMDLVGIQPRFDIYHMRSNTRAAFKSPGAFYSGQGAKVNGGAFLNGIAENGTIITGNVRNSVLSYGIRVERGAEVNTSVLHDRTVIGGGAKVTHALLDKNCVVGDGAEIDPIHLQHPSVMYRVVDLGSVDSKFAGHTLVQRAWETPELPAMDLRGFIPEREMVPLRGSDHGRFAEAVITPAGRVVLSKHSYVPANVVLGKH